MRCPICKSDILIKFVDGFGQKRCFCKRCGRSFLDYTRILPNGQKNLLKFENGIYYRPGVIGVR